MTSTPASQVRVFYRDYVNDVSIASTAAEPLDTARVAPLAETLLTAPDNFLGIIDAADAVLQCYLAEQPGDVVLELLYPETEGYLRIVLPRPEAMARLTDLPEQFDDALLAGGQYVA